MDGSKESAWRARCTHALRWRVPNRGLGAQYPEGAQHHQQQANAKGRYRCHGSSSAGAGLHGKSVIVHCRDGSACMALGYQVARTAFAVATLGGNAQFQLDFVKTHACPGKTCNLAVGDAVADADDHGGQGGVGDVAIINTNWSHYQFFRMLGPSPVQEGGTSRPAAHSVAAPQKDNRPRWAVVWNSAGVQNFIVAVSWNRRPAPGM